MLELLVCIKCLSYRALYLTMSKKIKQLISTAKKYSKTYVKWPLSKRPKIGFQDQYCVKKIKQLIKQLISTAKKYIKTYVKWPLSKRPKIGFQDKYCVNAGQKYCRMLPLEHSTILLTFNKLPYVILKGLLFCLFLSDRFTQVLLYLVQFYINVKKCKMKLM